MHSFCFWNQSLSNYKGQVDPFKNPWLYKVLYYAISGDFKTNWEAFQKGRKEGKKKREKGKKRGEKEGKKGEKEEKKTKGQKIEVGCAKKGKWNAKEGDFAVKILGSFFQIFCYPDPDQRFLKWIRIGLYDTDPKNGKLFLNWA